MKKKKKYTTLSFFFYECFCELLFDRVWEVGSFENSKVVLERYEATRRYEYYSLADLMLPAFLSLLLHFFYLSFFFLSLTMLFKFNLFSKVNVFLCFR